MLNDNRCIESFVRICFLADTKLEKIMSHENSPREVKDAIKSKKRSSLRMALIYLIAKEQKFDLRHRDLILIFKTTETTIIQAVRRMKLTLKQTNIPLHAESIH